MARLQFHRDLIKYLISSILFSLWLFYVVEDKNFLYHAVYLRWRSESILFYIFLHFFLIFSPLLFLFYPLECIRIIYEDILLPFIFHAIFFCLCPLNKHHPPTLLCTSHIILCVYFLSNIYSPKYEASAWNLFCLDFKGRKIEGKIHL